MDLYLVLGLQHGASESDIKRAYRRLARRFHPDINPGDQDAAVRFQQILEAYETLIDPERRSRYEAGDLPRPDARPRTSGFEGFDFSSHVPAHADQAVTFGELFADVLADRQSAPDTPQRGADLHQDVQLAFEEAFAGASRTVTVMRREACRTCAGTGAMRLAAAACAVCGGVGQLRSARGHMVFSRRCGTCSGTGAQRPRACRTCGGSGHETRADSVLVRIPPGIADGDRVRVDGMGNAGVRGGPRGALYLRVAVAPHPRFRRERDDIHVTVDIGIHEAGLGARIAVPAPDGEARLRVPPGTQSGQRFRLRGRGMPTRDGRRGDLIVEVHLKLPPVLDERSKELLREFGRIHGRSDPPAQP